MERLVSPTNDYGFWSSRAPRDYNSRKMGNCKQPSHKRIFLLRLPRGAEREKCGGRGTLLFTLNTKENYFLPLFRSDLSSTK